MKNTRIIIKQWAMCLIFTLMSVLSFAQCDTCHYDVDITFNPKYVDSFVVHKPMDTSEYTPCPTGSSVHKNISFVHGLGGNANSWAKQAVWSENNYKTTVINVNYEANLQSSFNYMGRTVNTQIGNGLAQGVNQVFPNRCPDNDFAIAHSQGGIVARVLDREWDVNTNGTYGTRKYFGLVTFTTPHSGADISKTRSQHASFVGQVVSSIILESATTKIYDFTGGVGFLFGISGANLQAKIDTLIKNDLAPLMLGSVHAPTLDEMNPASSTMTNLQNYDSRLRKVAFYATEEAPECWRVMSNMTDTAAEKYPIWQATRDNHFIDKMEKARAAHEGASISLGKDIRSWENQKRIPFWGLIKSKAKWEEMKDEKVHRDNAIEFINNANTQWRYLIGAYHRDSFETQTINLYIVKWDEKYGWLSKWYHQERSFYNYDQAVSYSNTRHGQVYQIKNKEIVTLQETRQVQKFFPNDGVVLVKSQKDFPGVGNRTDHLPGDNHFQARNSPETERVMKRLYLGGPKGYYDPFFATPKL